MAPNHPRPWRIRDLGTCLKIENAEGRNLAYVYYRKDGARLDKYLTHEEARAMAQAIGRLSRTPTMTRKPP